MTSAVERRLAAAGITVPDAPAPAGKYVPFVISRAHVYVSGQTPRVGGKVAYTGKLGRDMALEEGRLAARTCAINLLSQLKAACEGDLDRVARCVRLGGFVCCSDDFFQQPAVIDAASDVMLIAFGEAGRHARTAVGAAALPSNAAVEVDAVFELRDA
jgi:enamine deaminase RidA (YjgF/YER057c/UK114 family)